MHMTNSKTGFHNHKGVMYVDDVSLSDIAREYGTPSYVYSASVIREQYNVLEGALACALPKKKKHLLCYACKANSNIAILKLLRNLGCGLEIVSEGELVRGLKAGFKGNKIISTSFGKSSDEIRACLEADILQFNVEAEAELEMINAIAGQMGKIARVAFRLNPDIVGGGHSKISTGRKEDKFGNTAAKILVLYKRAVEEMEHVTPVGISMHIGSQISQADTFRPGFEQIAEVTEDLRAQGFEITHLDIGGGFPIVYDNEDILDLDEYAGWVKDFIVPLDVHIQMEPGRYMVGNAGILLSQVRYIKTTPSGKFMVLDAGMNDLVRPAMYGAYHEIRPIQNSGRTTTSNYDVVGPVCESGDLFAKGRECQDVEAGDLVALMSAGAYGFSMASNYNSRPLPTEILVDGDNVAVINKPQNIKDIMVRESIPSWL